MQRKERKERKEQASHWRNGKDRRRTWRVEPAAARQFDLNVAPIGALFVHAGQGKWPALKLRGSGDTIRNSPGVPGTLYVTPPGSGDTRFPKSRIRYGVPGTQPKSRIRYGVPGTHGVPGTPGTRIRYGVPGTHGVPGTPGTRIRYGVPGTPITLAAGRNPGE